MVNGDSDVIVGEDDELVDTATSSDESEAKAKVEDAQTNKSRESEANETDEPPEWVEWRETSNTPDLSEILPNEKLQGESSEAFITSPSSADTLVKDDNDKNADRCLVESQDEITISDSSAQLRSDGETQSLVTTMAENITSEENTQEATVSDKEE